MQIRLVVGILDKRYLELFAAYLERIYADMIELLAFSGEEILRSYFTLLTADFILLDEAFEELAGELKTQGRIALLSEKGMGRSGEGLPRIARFKKPDLIYKDILGLYADSGRRPISGGAGGSSEGEGQLILVTGCSGGTGASTFAAALAKKYASRGKQVLYLNLEPAGMSTDFFSGAGDYFFDDIIFALKSQRADLRLKLESAVRTDASGVHFFAPCTKGLYMLELNHADQMRLLETLAGGMGYDAVILDMNFQISMEFLKLAEKMSRIILVQDGGEISNSKFQRTMESLHIMEEERKLHVTGTMQLLYNRFSSSKSSSEIPGARFPVLGKIPPIKHALTGEIIAYMLTRQDIFDRL